LRRTGETNHRPRNQNKKGRKGKKKIGKKKRSPPPGQKKVKGWDRPTGTGRRPGKKKQGQNQCPAGDNPGPREKRRALVGETKTERARLVSPRGVALGEKQWEKNVKDKHRH